MKIPLKIANEQLEIAGVFRASQYRIFCSVIFVVDTGSNMSFISYGDAVSYNFPLDSMPFKEHSRIGGFVFELRELQGASLSFENAEGRLEKFFLSNFHASKSTKTGKEREQAKTIPSILGLDFLNANNLALYVHPSKNIAYLEKQ